MRYTVLHALKHEGVLHLPGAVVDLSEAVVRLLPPGVVAAEAPASLARSGPVSSADRAKEIREAQIRVARATGTSLPPDFPVESPADV